MMFLLLLLVPSAAFYYFTTPEERTRIWESRLTYVAQAKELIERYRPEYGEVGEALVARTPLVVATPALVAVNVLVFLGMLFGAGSFGDPETLLGWGASFGPSTTNGEWTRLLTSTFVHGGLFQMVFCVAAMGMAGLILERLYGMLAFAAVYIGAGLLSNVVGLAIHPVDVMVGSAGAVSGVLGLLVASIVAGRFVRGSVALPLEVLVRLVPATALFLLYALASGHAGLPEAAGFAVGLVSGLALSVNLKEHRPSFVRVGGALGASLTVVAVFAVPLRGMANVRPEIARVIELEEKTAKAYAEADATYRNSTVSMVRQAEAIEKKILPELASARARIDALDRVPRPHQEVVRLAQEYLKLREKAWQARDDGLRKPNMQKLRAADQAERTALAAFDKLKAAAASDGA